MAAEKDQRVSFTRQHDRAHVLTGTVAEVKGDEVLIATEPDGVKIWALAADASALPEEDTAPEEEDKQV